MSKNTQSFDLEKLKQLFEMMEQHDVTEINLRNQDEQWRLKRGSTEFVQAVPMVAASAPAPTAAPATAASASAPPAEAPANTGPTIDSPTVGTFYVATSPDDPPLVSVGARVTPDTAVCVIEAMKVFNTINAEVSGTITEVLVENGKPVDFGQPLFRYQPG